MRHFLWLELVNSYSHRRWFLSLWAEAPENFKIHRFFLSYSSSEARENTSRKTLNCKGKAWTGSRTWKWSVAVSSFTVSRRVVFHFEGEQLKTLRIFPARLLDCSCQRLEAKSCPSPPILMGLDCVWKLRAQAGRKLQKTVPGHRKERTYRWTIHKKTIWSCS